MDRYLCVHGHFYQPPRENPWLEEIEVQDSAYPYHDWNERISDESYAPNTASRVLDREGRIEKIVNNYSRMSFNFGPTLLSWLETKDPDTYRSVLNADRESRLRFSGHGSALAQVYNHMILPLANARDRRTQVRWGIRDFEKRFGRAPEGIWLAETAVDLESLEVLAAEGIRFTILAPSQAARVRKIGAKKWREVGGARIDPTMAYEVALPSGEKIAVFFYDGPVSRAIAFEGLLDDGERLAGRLVGAFSDARSWRQLVHIATDGETYGHHHRHGEMALTWALNAIESRGQAQLTIYGEHLERNPPTHQAEIFERSSWSCVHGVERWWRDCGCSSGGHGDWNQVWRTPLRDALDGLRDGLKGPFEAEASRLLRDPWAARDDYIEVILDRSSASLAAFIGRHAARRLDGEETTRVLKLMELQRHAMLMYTSCGWFFDDISGIETIQVILYAGRVVQLARESLDTDPEPGLLAKLAEAKSNIPEQRDGALVYETFVRPAMVSLPGVCAHYAISSVFDSYADQSRIYCYTIERKEMKRFESGRHRLLVGSAWVRSEITGESQLLSFGVLHLGDHGIQAGIRPFRSEEALAVVTAEAAAALGAGDLPGVILLLDRHFEGITFSLGSLFRDEQRRIVDVILKTTIEDAEARFRDVYEGNVSLMAFLGRIGTPLPRALKTAAEFVINTNLRRALSEAEPDLDRIRALMETAAREKVPLDAPGHGYALERVLESMMERLRDTPGDLALLTRIESLARFVEEVPFEVDLWKTQNIYHELLVGKLPGFRQRRDSEGHAWVHRFTSLGKWLSIRPD